MPCNKAATVYLMLNTCFAWCRMVLWKGRKAHHRGYDWATDNAILRHGSGPLLIQVLGGWLSDENQCWLNISKWVSAPWIHVPNEKIRSLSLSDYWVKGTIAHCKTSNLSHFHPRVTNEQGFSNPYSANHHKLKWWLQMSSWWIGAT